MAGKKSISCIIITPGLNNRFVCEKTIPSIVKTTEHLIQWDVEIIVVDNSFEQNFEYYCTDNGYDNILNCVDRVVGSEPNHIPKAYNKGVKLSKNYHIAIFHDDCIIKDKLWVEKMTKELSELVYIVGIEEHNDAKPYKDIVSTRYVKEVPLVMKKSCFNDIGGYDETYYLGFENVMICNKVYNLGKKIVVLNIEHTHFNGLSTMSILTKEGVTNELETIISMVTNKGEFKKLQKELLGTIEVNLGDMFSNRLLRWVMYLIGVVKPIKMTKGFGTNLGYSKCFSYWNTMQIPTEVIMGLMPKTRKDFEILLKDIKCGMDGELYSKLNKHKGPLFMEYFNGR